MPALTVFGDSIAHGGGDLACGGWPLRLRRHLRRHGLGDQLWVQAVSGHTSFDLLRRMPVELPLRPAETVLIAIGSNDAQLLVDADHPRTTDHEFAANLAALIALAKQHARWVVPLAPPLPSATPRPGPRPIPRARVQALGEVVRRVAEEHGCWWIDLRPTLDDGCLPDGVHPDSAGHARIAAAVWRGLLPTGCLGPEAAALPAPGAE